MPLFETHEELDQIRLWLLSCGGRRLPIAALRGGVLEKGRFARVYKRVSGGAELVGVNYGPLYPLHALISPYLLQMQISFCSAVPHQKYELNDNFIYYSYLGQCGRLNLRQTPVSSQLRTASGSSTRLHGILTLVKALRPHEKS